MPWGPGKNDNLDHSRAEEKHLTPVLYWVACKSDFFLGLIGYGHCVINHSTDPIDAVVEKDICSHGLYGPTPTLHARTGTLDVTSPFGSMLGRLHN